MRFRSDVGGAGLRFWRRLLQRGAMSRDDFNKVMEATGGWLFVCVVWAGSVGVAGGRGGEGV